MRTLGLFCKQPVAGLVKTRLASDIGKEAAARLYAAFIEDMASRFCREGDRRIIGYWPPDSNKSFRHYEKMRFDLWPQPEGHLGKKIASFFEMALAHNSTPGLTTQSKRPNPSDHPDHTPSILESSEADERRASISIEHSIEQHNDRLNATNCDLSATPTSKAVLIGSDSPTLPNEFIRQAFDKLDQSDCVIGPATDGGYYLIGLRKHVADLFEDISWSSPDVLLQTVHRVESRGLTMDVLPPWYDVDELPALQLLAGHLRAMTRAGHTHPCPLTAAVLATLPELSR